MPRPKTKKTFAEYEKERDRRNEYQKEYRRRNKDLVILWQQRNAANLLRKYGWTVTPPPNFPTLEEAHKKRDFIEHNTIDTPPIDLSDVDELLKGMAKDDLPFE